jgi:hypothetical protein
MPPPKDPTPQGKKELFPGHTRQPPLQPRNPKMPRGLDNSPPAGPRDRRGSEYHTRDARERERDRRDRDWSIDDRARYGEIEPRGSGDRGHRNRRYSRSRSRSRSRSPRRPQYDQYRPSKPERSQVPQRQRLEIPKGRLKAP